MSLPAPKPLSISKSPSRGPAEARVAAQDAQIAQLVQQNRTLEHTLAQLRNQLKEEEARGIDAVNQIREKWKAESKEWRDGCDSLQAKHRLAHLGTRIALENERGFRLEDREALLHEKTATLMREYKITLFQARETDLVSQVAALEDEIQSQREEMVDILSQPEAELTRLIIQLTHAEARQQDDVERVGSLAQEKNALEEELATLRASSSSTAKQVDRLTLQIETLRTQNSSLEARNKELQHQVDKWQSLEGKGEKEVESLRKRRIELEVRVKELEVNLKESRALSKKIAKLEESLLDTQEQVEQGQQDTSEAQAETARAQKQVTKLERQVEKLQAALETEKTRNVEASMAQKATSQSQSIPPKKLRSRVPPTVQEEREGSENEKEELPSKPRSRSQKPASIRGNKAKGRGKMKEMETVADEPATERPKRPKGRDNGKQHEKESKVENVQLEDGELEDGELEDELEEDEPEEDEPMGDDIAEAEVQAVRPPTKRHDRHQTQYSDVKEVAPPAKKSRSKKPPSKMAKVQESDSEDQKLPKRGRSKPPSTMSGQKQSEVDTEEEQPAKKKKRKLNIKGSSSVFGGPAGFTWNQGEDGDLGIPSVLSPLKEGQPVPPRSTSTSILSAFKMW